MAYFEYKIVPAPQGLPKGRGAPTERLSRTLSDILNAEGEAGWEFQKSETLTVEAKSGFLSRARPQTLSVLVFRRWVDEPSGVAASPETDEIEPHGALSATRHQEPTIRPVSAPGERR